MWQVHCRRLPNLALLCCPEATELSATAACAGTLRLCPCCVHPLDNNWMRCTTQAIRQGQVAERLENLRQEYISFLYGFEAVGAGAVRSDLSTEQAALFQTTDLANIFFRYRREQRL